MDLTKFTQRQITKEQFDLLPEGTDIWVNGKQWVSNHGGILILTTCENFFFGAWKMFLLTPIKK